MEITYDPPKQQKTLDERGLDFNDAPFVFETAIVEFEDTRFDYPETRMVTFGLLAGRLVAVVWTQTGEDTRHIISMRKANDREKKRLGQ